MAEELDLSIIPPEVLAGMPALPPPPGVTSNFVNPESLEWHARGVAIALLPLTFAHVALRLYTRIKSRMIGWDDCFCAIAWILSVAFTILVLIVAEKTLGRHQWDISILDITETFNKILFGATSIYFVLMVFLKTSILFLYWRLFRTIRAIRLSIIIGSTIIVLFYLSNIAAIAVTCSPGPGESWVSQLTKKRCAETAQQSSVATGAFGVVSDFYILLAPLLPVYGLQISKRKKIGLFGIFATGLLACGTAICSLVVRVRAKNSLDITWCLLQIQILGFCEINIGIICSCMPIVYVAFKDLPRKIHSAFSYLTVSSSEHRSAAHNWTGRASKTEKSSEDAGTHASVEHPRLISDSTRELLAHPKSVAYYNRNKLSIDNGDMNFEDTANPILVTKSSDTSPSTNHYYTDMRQRFG